ncbi:unnamed protein product [Lactuca virosa]|uniref:Uncharacterized protein n=1 Tax=Lactuca virosa TaxID=75947 RepID=A0AAU9N4U4_9ASTR|nr:unnamed protein product [Lactuca virosa]
MTSVFHYLGSPITFLNSTPATVKSMYPYDFIWFHRPGNKFHSPSSTLEPMTRYVEVIDDDGFQVVFLSPELKGFANFESLKLKFSTEMMKNNG